MKSATAAYWLPLTVLSIDERPSTQIGYQAKREHDLSDEQSLYGIDEWVKESLDYFKSIYGSVVDAHYVVEDIRRVDGGRYDFHISLVVTGLVDSEDDFQKKVFTNWGLDLAESLQEHSDMTNNSMVTGYDLNPIQDEPQWSKYNS